MVFPDSGTLAARKATVAKTKEALDARHTALFTMEDLRNVINIAIAKETRALELRSRALQREEDLFVMMATSEFTEDFVVRDEGNDECGEGAPPEPKKRKADSYDDRLQVALREVADAHETAEEFAAMVDSLRQRIIDFDRESVAALRDIRRNEKQVDAFLQQHYKAPALKLPPEMLHIIFQYLSMNDIVSAGQVCSSWRAAVKDRAVWNDASLEHPSRLVDLVTFRRILKAAPFLKQLRVNDHFSFNSCDTLPKVGTLVLVSDVLYCQTGIPKAITTYKGQTDGLCVSVSKLGEAKSIDTRFPGLKMLAIHFRIKKPYVFRGRVTQRSSLTTLRLMEVPPATLMSLVKAHQQTLQWVGCVSSWERQYDFLFGTPPTPSATGADVTEALKLCPRLKKVEVACRDVEGLALPACCSELVLVVTECSKEVCGAPAAVSSWSGLKRLSLVSKHCRYSRDGPGRMRRHLLLLDERYLAAMQQVSLRFPQDLSDVQKQWNTGEYERCERDKGIVVNFVQERANIIIEPLTAEDHMFFNLKF